MRWPILSQRRERVFNEDKIITEYNISIPEGLRTYYVMLAHLVSNTMSAAALEQNEKVLQELVDNQDDPAQDLPHTTVEVDLSDLVELCGLLEAETRERLASFGKKYKDSAPYEELEADLIDCLIVTNLLDTFRNAFHEVAQEATGKGGDGSG